ncbi:MAG: leucine-rich repeat protein, partial [Oscillospiraceae bacterium]|nr:leucine-rich repeat protein [Oscillospiraceae bacterium]
MRKLKAFLAGMTALSCCCAGCLPIAEQITSMYSVIANAEDTEEIATSGTCGENLTWNFDESTGTLTISGTGAMTDWKYGESPWYNNKNIKEIIIKDSVTTIGDRAFWDCFALESITIPESVETIGKMTFYGCTALESITIPKSVEIIGDMAFHGCTALESVTIPDSVKVIKDGTFCYCSALESVKIPNSVTTIGDYAFGGCNVLTSITIENPDCDIYDSDYIISDDAIIYGYTNSTAQAYAETYHKNFISLGTAPEILIGDADKDGEFNILDVIVLQKWLLGAGNLPNWKAVDFNQDGI